MGPPSLILLSIPFALMAFMSMLEGRPMLGFLLSFMATGLASLAWYGWKSFPDDDHDDVIYHGVPVETPKPIEEDNSEKQYLD